MKKKRDKTFIWISWLAKLLAGEIQCEFSCWFKSHYSYDKLPSDFNLVRWTMDHNQLVHKTRDELEKQGYKVTIEDQNAFKEIIFDALVSAKPDIVAYKKDKDLDVDYREEKLAIDCKTGRPKNSDQIQVLLYMMFLKSLEGGTWDGKVTYKSNSSPVPSVMLTQSFMDLVNETIKKLSTDNPARKVPSENECRRCDISEEDCPERLESDGRQY